jgi:hypothetical protein
LFEEFVEFNEFVGLIGSRRTAQGTRRKHEIKGSSDTLWTDSLKRGQSNRKRNPLYLPYRKGGDDNFSGA